MGAFLHDLGKVEERFQTGIRLVEPEPERRRRRRRPRWS